MMSRPYYVAALISFVVGLVAIDCSNGAGTISEVRLLDSEVDSDTYCLGNVEKGDWLRDLTSPEASRQDGYFHADNKNLYEAHEATGHQESSYEVTSPATLTEDARLGVDLGEAQVIDIQYSEKIAQTIEEARDYVQNVVMVDEKYANVRGMCRNAHSQCAFWAILGECEKNPGYMQVQCGPVCKSCDKIDVAVRCPVDPQAQDALRPGALNRMFERIVTEPWYQQFEPVVLSRPYYAEGDTAANATYRIGLWLIMFDNALSDEEADRMIELGGTEGYQRSTGVGELKSDGNYVATTSSSRTSTNAVSVSRCEIVCES